MILLGYLSALGMGLTLGLVGGGGSILTVPILVYLFHVSPVLSTVYSLLVVGLTSLIGSISHARQGNICFKTGVIFSIPAFLGVFLSRKYLVANLPEILILGELTISKDALIMSVFAVIMVLAAIMMIRPQKTPEQPKEVHFWSPQNIAKIGAEGLIVGGVTGFVGAGGGFLIIPALVVLAGLPIKKAIGTSLMIIAAKSLLGILGDVALLQQADWGFLGIFSILAIGGILLGSYVARFVPSNKLKPAFGWFVLIMGGFILVKELGFENLTRTMETLDTQMTTYLYSLAGGVLIGLSATLLILFNGRIAGISGIFGGLLQPQKGDIQWRLYFVAGLIGGGAILMLFMPEAFVYDIDRSLPLLVVGGLLVGVGTKLGSGCTSGHGVCGIGRLSGRSMAATGTFIALGMISVFVLNQLMGGLL